MNQLKLSFILFCAIASLVLSGLIHHYQTKPALQITKQVSALNLSHDFLKLASSGQKRLISDLLWITTLLESDTDHYQKKDLNSWLYLRFKSIASLDERFIRNYQFGGKYLSIIKDDISGAEDLYNQGLGIYPDDYDLISGAAFLYAFEKKDSKKAYDLYSKIKDHPKAPSFIKTILPKLKVQESGDLEFAYEYLQNLLKEEKNEALLFKIKHDLYIVKAHIDLKCLNEKRKDCDLYDYEGNKYLFDGSVFRSERAIPEYRLKDF